MGRKHVLKPYQVITAGDMSADITSEVVTVTQLDRVAFEVAWSGTTPVGTLFVDAQISPDLGVWTALDIDTMNVSGNSGNHLITVEVSNFVSVRLRYVFGSGTGTLTAYIAGSGVGA